MIFANSIVFVDGSDGITVFKTKTFGKSCQSDTKNMKPGLKEEVTKPFMEMKNTTIPGLHQGVEEQRSIRVIIINTRCAD